MNLIEQFGGYEKAKLYLEEELNTPTHELREDTITWLPDALLEYRREHNIFEVGDFVVRTSGIDWELHKIEIIKEYDLKIFSQDMSHSYWVIKGKYRHTTDAEIEVGHRL